MSNSVRHFDTGAMRAAASDIRAKIRNYTAAMGEVDTTINGMKAYWQDEVNQNFVRRYDTDLKKTAEDVKKLMESYAEFLDETARVYDKIVADGNAGING